MALSRLRLQLAAWFALVFLLGLGAADFVLFIWLQRVADHRLSGQMAAAAAGVAEAVRREMLETRVGPDAAAREVLGEWPADSNGYLVHTADTTLATRAPDRLARLVPPAAQLPPGDRTWDVPLDAEGGLRLSLAHSPASSAMPAFSVLALQSTSSLREGNERLALRLSLSAPLVVLLALVGAYFLARRALVPLRTMTREITALAPGDLDRRLTVRAPPDELDALADQFNRLLERLSLAQQRNRRFVAQAAHQLRTPLTVIRGESSLGLERPRTVEEHRDVLRRVSLAAEQMTHRVNDLFLLAQAESGDRPTLTDEIELDGVVLECVDLMRGRADALGRHLELGTMDAAEITGSEPLIREAVLELLENACRHGQPTAVIRISTVNGGAMARVDVTSAGPPVALPVPADGEAARDGAGLGLSIVRWIAAMHAGALSYRNEGDANTFTLELAASPGQTPEERSG